MYFIGVDLGTSAVKLLLMDEEGKIVNIVSTVTFRLHLVHRHQVRWSRRLRWDLTS